MPRLTLFSLLLFLVLLFLLPLIFGQLLAGSLLKLHLSPQAAVMIALAIILGGLINIPVGRIRHGEATVIDPLAIFGLSGFLPQMQRLTRDTLIAVNVGGAIIPAALAIYELYLLAAPGKQMLGTALLATLPNIVLCYATARVVPGIGITMPALLPPGIAAISALLLAPQEAAPVAFIAGVAGPLIGADLLHLKDVRSSPVGIASIGGAGTFDGIVLSGIIAVYLA